MSKYFHMSLNNPNGRGPTLKVGKVRVRVPLQALFSFLAILFLVLPAGAVTRDEALQSAVRIRDLARQQAVSLARAKAQLATVSEEHEKAVVDLAATKAWGTEQETERWNEFKRAEVEAKQRKLETARADKFSRAYNLLTWPLAIAAGAAVFLALLRLPPMLGPYQPLAAGAISVGLCFLIHAQIGRALGVHQ